MNILITGSEGTLGRVLKAELRGRGHRVFGLDLQHSHDPDHVRCDVSDCAQVVRAVTTINERPGNPGIDAVYHLAAEFGRINGAHYPEQLWRTNQIGTKNIIRLCVDIGARLILAGSSEAYGETGNENGLVETYLDNFAPHHHNEYALSKWTQERQVFIAAETEGLNAVVLRFFNAYGPGEYFTPYRSVVCLFCYRMLFGLPITVYKNYHRVFMWVGDWARTAANVAERFDKLPRGHQGQMNASRPMTVPVYNIGGVEYRSVEELVDLVGRAAKTTDADIRYEEKEAANVTNKRPDVSQAIRDLGHDPMVTLEQGVPLTIEWMRQVYSPVGDRAEDMRTRSFARRLYDPFVPPTEKAKTTKAL